MMVNVYITMGNHNSQWENSLSLWPFSIAVSNYQRVTEKKRTNLIHDANGCVKIQKSHEKHGGYGNLNGEHLISSTLKFPREAREALYSDTSGASKCGSSFWKSPRHHFGLTTIHLGPSMICAMSSWMDGWIYGF